MFKKSTRKLLFCSTDLWRKIFLFKRNFVFKLGEKFIYNRSSVIPKSFTNMNVRIYSGKRWHTRFLSKWSVGFKMGELTWNRKRARYKAKQLKKKKK